MDWTLSLNTFSWTWGTETTLWCSVLIVSAVVRVGLGGLSIMSLLGAPAALLFKILFIIRSGGMKLLQANYAIF